MHLYFTFKFRNYLNQFSTPILSENLLKLNMIVIPARMYRRAYVLQNTQIFLISNCGFCRGRLNAQNLNRTCLAIVVLIKSFILVILSQ